MAVVDILIPAYRGLQPMPENSVREMIARSQCRCTNNRGELIHAPWECKRGKHDVYRVPSVASAVIHWGRNHMVSEALYGPKFTHPDRPPAEFFFLIDDDMVCQPEHLDRLLSYDLDIVSGVPTKRRDPPEPTLRMWDAGMGKYQDLREWDFGTEKLLEVDGAGAAYMLVKRRVFEKMADAYLDCFFERREDAASFDRANWHGLTEKSTDEERDSAESDRETYMAIRNAYWDRVSSARKEHFALQLEEQQNPDNQTVRASASWFEFKKDLENGRGEFGEDLAFCWKAKMLGFHIFADSQVQPGHMGEYAYGMWDYIAYREAQKQMSTPEERQEYDLSGAQLGPSDSKD